MGVWAVVAALITAAISYISIVVSKENKISEFREKWINELRNEITFAITYTINIQEITSNIINVRSQIVEAKNILEIDGKNNEISKFEYYELVKYLQILLIDYRKNFIQITQSLSKIKVTVNKNEKEFLDTLNLFHDSFLKLNLYIQNEKIKNMNEFITSEEFIAFTKYSNLFLNGSQKLLKIEWDRVKSGEKSFISIKENILKIFSFFISILLAYILYQFFIEIKLYCNK